MQWGEYNVNTGEKGSLKFIWIIRLQDYSSISAKSGLLIKIKFLKYLRKPSRLQAVMLFSAAISMASLETEAYSSLWIRCVSEDEPKEHKLVVVAFQFFLLSEFFKLKFAEVLISFPGTYRLMNRRIWFSQAASLLSLALGLLWVISDTLWNMREAKKNLHPFLDVEGNLRTKGEKKAEELNTSLPHFLITRPKPVVFKVCSSLSWKTDREEKEDPWFRRKWSENFLNTLPSDAYWHWWGHFSVSFFSRLNRHWGWDFPQPFLIREMFQFVKYLFCPLLELIQELHVCLALKSPELDTAHQGWV